MTFLEIQKEICAELNVDYTIVAVGTHELYTITEIKKWANMAKDWCLSFKKWPFLETSGTDLIDATGKYPYPALMKTKSAFIITVAGERYVKISYEDYLKYFEDDADGEDRIWAEWDRDIYINGNACDVGDAIIIYGQAGEADLSADAALTPFAAAEPNGDEAVIKKAVSLAMRKNRQRFNESKLLEIEAKDILSMIWDRLSEAMPREVRKSTPVFKRVNVLDGTIGEVGQDLTGKFS